jgi:membrane-associated phospholipid phosphatase
LGVAFIAGGLFAIFPQLDLTLARSFYDSSSGQFRLHPAGAAEVVRSAAMWIAWGLAVPAFLAPLWKLIRPQKPLLVRGRAILFLVTTIFLTAIVLPNVIFKSHWGRPRPITTVEFGGSETFRPWWDPRGSHRHNGSFFSGEAATAFWTYAPAALAPPPFRALAFAAATVFGLTTGVLRMAFGAHYASDIIAAGVAAFLVVWVMHGLIYRWKPDRWSDERIDRWLADVARQLRSVESFWSIAAAVAGLTMARLMALHFSVVDFFPDEARYWAWAQTPAFGYFSKPPLLAWMMAATGKVWGNSEACLRAAAPMLYAGTALICAVIARQLYDKATAFWVGLSVVFATGLVYSARIISTDVVLLFFWSLALLAYLKLLARPTLGWSTVLGFALGLGMLAKYAMIYFLAGAVVASVLDPGARALWSRPGLWFGLLIALLLFTPNLIWNATHDFVTFRHTRGNIVGDGFKFSPLGPLVFLGSQFGVVGPILFSVFALALLRPGRSQFNRGDRLMLAFALPALAAVTAAAFFTGTEANWAATSAISIVILATAVLVRLKQWHWLKVSLALGLCLQVVLMVADSVADRLSVPFLAKPDVYHRTMGWKAMSDIVRQRAQTNGIRSVAAENGDVVAELLYYLRDDPWPVFSWRAGPIPLNQFDLDRPWTDAVHEPVLFIADHPPPAALTRAYSSQESLPSVEAVTGPHSSRQFLAVKLWRAAR